MDTVVAKERTVGEMQKELLGRVRPAIQEIWPSSDASLQDFDVVLGTAGIAIDVRYQAPKIWAKSRSIWSCKACELS